MALEKTKKDKIKTPDNIKKTKRNRHKTECLINRMHGCGVCGSRNTALQGITYCNICGQEIEFLNSGDYIWGCTIDPKCNCKKTRKNHKGILVFYRDLNYIYVGKCLDCGAVKSSFCPNCKRKRSCWKSWNGKKFCQSCGFRKN